MSRVRCRTLRIMPAAYAHDPLGLPAALALLIDVLAVFRLVRLVLADVILDRPRGWLIARSRRKASTIAYFLSCAWCTSIWLAAAAVAARLWIPRLWAPVAVALALSAAASVLMSRAGD